MTDCIIFDFDGTIADTSAGIIATTQEAFRQLGFPKICPTDQTDKGTQKRSGERTKQRRYV